MKKYTVADKKGLVIGGFGDRYFKAGDVVSENDFIAGIAENLVERGELIPIASDDDLVDEDPEGDEIDTMKKSEIIAKLKELKVDYNKSDSEDVLRELLKSSLNEEPLDLTID